MASSGTKIKSGSTMGVLRLGWRIPNGPPSSGAPARNLKGFAGWSKAGKATKAAKAAKATAAAVDPSWIVTDAELEALAALKGEGTWVVGGQELKLTNLDKVLFPPRDGVDEPPPDDYDEAAEERAIEAAWEHDRPIDPRSGYHRYDTDDDFEDGAPIYADDE